MATKQQSPNSTKMQQGSTTWLTINNISSYNHLQSSFEWCHLVITRPRWTQKRRMLMRTMAVTCSSSKWRESKNTKRKVKCRHRRRRVESNLHIILNRWIRQVIHNNREIITNPRQTILYRCTSLQLAFSLRYDTLLTSMVISQQTSESCNDCLLMYINDARHSSLWETSILIVKV